jgi:hypothetical protein
MVENCTAFSRQADTVLYTVGRRDDDFCDRIDIGRHTFTD